MSKPDKIWNRMERSSLSPPLTHNPRERSHLQLKSYGTPRLFLHLFQFWIRLPMIWLGIAPPLLLQKLETKGRKIHWQLTCPTPHNTFATILCLGWQRLLMPKRVLSQILRMRSKLNRDVNSGWPRRIRGQSPSELRHFREIKVAYFHR